MGVHIRNTVKDDIATIAKLETSETEDKHEARKRKELNVCGPYSDSENTYFAYSHIFPARHG